jgi:hypothetical protein
LSLTVNDFSFDSNAMYGNNALPAAPRYAVRGEILYRHPRGFFVGPTFDVVDSRAGCEAAILNPGEPRSAYVGFQTTF